MPSQILGGNAQEWVNRGARERWFVRYSASLNVVLSIAVVFTSAVLGYVGLHPRYIPVVLTQQRDGSYMPWSESAPNDAGERKLLADWLANWRVGCSDPRSLPCRQTAALIATGSGDAVATQVRAYDQQVADGGLAVVPTVRTVLCSGYECEADWDEAVTAATTETSRSMRAYFTIAFDEQHVNLRNDPLLNPFGMYLRDLRVVEIGHAH